MPLGPGAKAGDWIHDFVNSSAPQFKGKSKADRIRMALGAYYAKHALGGAVGNRFAAGGMWGSGPTGTTTNGPTATDWSSPGAPPGASGYWNGQFVSRPASDPYWQQMNPQPLAPPFGGLVPLTDNDDTARSPYHKSSSSYTPSTSSSAPQTPAQPPSLDPGQLLRATDESLGPFGRSVSAPYPAPPPQANMQWSGSQWTNPTQPAQQQTTQQAGAGPFAHKRGGTVNRFAAGGMWANDLFQPQETSGWNSPGSYFPKPWPSPVTSPQLVGVAPPVSGMDKGGNVPKTVDAASASEPSDPATFVPIVPAWTPDYLRAMELMHRNRMRAQGIK